MAGGAAGPLKRARPTLFSWPRIGSGGCARSTTTSTPKSNAGPPDGSCASSATAGGCSRGRFPHALRPQPRPTHGSASSNAPDGGITGRQPTRDRLTKLVNDPWGRFDVVPGMRKLLTALAVVVALDVALLLAADRRPEVTVVTLEPIGTASRSTTAPRVSAGAAVTTPAPGTAAPAVTCNTPAPSPTWTCQNGAWVMVPTTSGTGAASGSSGVTAPGAGAGAGNCPGVQPGAGWTCRGGAWTPPAETPNAGAPTGTPNPPAPSIEINPSPAQPPAQPACSAPNPGAGMPGVVARCVNGTWVIGGA